jgi:hypothetical protein
MKIKAGYFDPAELSSKFTHLRIRISAPALNYSPRVLRLYLPLKNMLKWEI